MFELITMIGIIYLIYIIKKLLNLLNGFIHFQKNELEEIKTKIDLTDEYINSNKIIDYSYHIKEIFYLERMYESLRMNDGDTDDTIIKRIDKLNQFEFAVKLKEQIILYFFQLYHTKMIDYMREIEKDVLLGKIDYKESQNQISKYQEKIGKKFDKERDFNEYKKLVEGELGLCNKTIEYKGFDIEELKKQLLYFSDISMSLFSIVHKESLLSFLVTMDLGMKRDLSNN